MSDIPVLWIIGLSIAWLVAPRLQPLLFKQSAVDAVTYSAVALTMLVAALLASALPAARAARADPIVALRSD